MKVLDTKRLVADEGKVVTNGISRGIVVDLSPDESVDDWYEEDIKEEDLL